MVPGCFVTPLKWAKNVGDFSTCYSPAFTGKLVLRASSHAELRVLFNSPVALNISSLRDPQYKDPITGYYNWSDLQSYYNVTESDSIRQAAEEGGLFCTICISDTGIYYLACHSELRILPRRKPLHSSSSQVSGATQAYFHPSKDPLQLYSRNFKSIMGLT